MGYSNLFKLFAASSLNLYDDAGWDSESERLAGFVSGNIAKSKNVNTAIKSNSLVTMALMDFVASNGQAESTIELGLASTVDTLKAAIISAIANTQVKKAEMDKDARKFTEAYAANLFSSINAQTGVITLQLMSYDEHAGTRFIGDSALIDLVPKANALVATESNSNAEYKFLLRPSGSQSGSASKMYYGQNYNPTFNPSNGRFSVRQVHSPVQTGNYVVCNTPGGTTAKTVKLDGFTLDGAPHVFVRFTYSNTTENPTLNVNGTGNIAIATSSDGMSFLVANKVYEFVYDGTLPAWVIVNQDVPKEAITANKIKGLTNEWSTISFANGSTVDIYWNSNAVYEFRAYADYGSYKKEHRTIGFVFFPTGPIDEVPYEKIDSAPFISTPQTHDTTSFGLFALRFFYDTTLNRQRCTLMYLDYTDGFKWKAYPAGLSGFVVAYRKVQ